MPDQDCAADGSLVVMRDASDYRSLVTTRAFAAGEVLARFSAREVLDRPNHLTVQVRRDRHILLAPEHLQYTNHSCDPNVFFDTARGEIVTLRPIPAHAPVTFFYPSTEWTMDRAFACHCGTAACLGTIAGAGQLDPAQLAPYRLADHIIEALATAAAAVAG